MLLSLLLLAAPLPLRAHPMAERCAALAPKDCALSKASKPEAVLACFSRPDVRLDNADRAQRACLKELGEGRLRQACDPKELSKLCGRAKPGADGLTDCLRLHRKETSKACHDAVEDYDAMLGPEPPAPKKAEAPGVKPTPNKPEATRAKPAPGR
jgi:hypothetical protein